MKKCVLDPGEPRLVSGPVADDRDVGLFQFGRAYIKIPWDYQHDGVMMQMLCFQKPLNVSAGDEKKEQLLAYGCISKFQRIFDDSQALVLHGFLRPYTTINIARRKQIP